MITELSKRFISLGDNHKPTRHGSLNKICAIPPARKFSSRREFSFCFNKHFFRASRPTALVQVCRHLPARPSLSWSRTQS